MGHYWSVKCLDCGDEAIMGSEASKGSGGLETMQALISLAPCFGPLLPVLNAKDVYSYNFEINSCDIDIEFYHQHARHRLVPVIDYGVCLGQCQFKEDGCLLKEDHEGPCNTTDGPYKVGRKEL